MIYAVASYIAGLVPALTVGENLIIGKFPTVAPDLCVALLPRGGVPDGYRLDFSRYSMQVVVRGTDYEAADAIAQSIFTAIHGVSGDTIPAVSPDPAYHVASILANQQPYTIGQDVQSGRAAITTNYTLTLLEE